MKTPADENQKVTAGLDLREGGVSNLIRKSEDLPGVLKIVYRRNKTVLRSGVIYNRLGSHYLVLL